MTYTEAGNSIPSDAYFCPVCGLKVKHFGHEEFGKLEILNGTKIEEIVIRESHLVYFDNWESAVPSLMSYL